MAIRPSDARKLWGKAGGRCTVCRREGGAEIAHIVARRPNGPRGDDPLPLEQRDLYENLILLCPNHHSTADVNPEEWPVSRLRNVKAEHELWIEKRLEQGTIRVSEVEVSAFAEERVATWQTIEQHAWLFLSLTPLEVREERVEPVAKQIQDLLNSLPMPKPYWDALGTNLNSNNTEPSARGLLNEDFRRLSRGVGFRVEIFRNGHAESVTCIDKLLLSEEYVGQLTPPIQLSSSEHRLTKCKRAIEYKGLAELLLGQLQQLHKLWVAVPLPAADMLLTAGILNCTGACLLAFNYSEVRAFIGRCIEDKILQYGVIAEKSATMEEIYNTVLSRLVNSMGLHLYQVWEEGDIPLPRYL